MDIFIRNQAALKMLKCSLASANRMCPLVRQAKINLGLYHCERAQQSQGAWQAGGPLRIELLLGQLSLKVLLKRPRSIGRQLRSKSIPKPHKQGSLIHELWNNLSSCQVGKSSKRACLYV
ncbi:hypothetical protein [Vitiosangium sp. GDMCC 1.1324]|uniref:hypothetical protein n=1 Tax=Vitiosangium sp. (strain GDMCC 1.1324) TaxID=2138576 RepID=UPI0011B5187A|nr:hypothetical protein [Vitiosangium sp. GDMCC 1.1324]